MHIFIFIMLITSVQSFKLITCEPWEELITQTCYPTLKANLKIVLSRKCPNFVKNCFCVYKNSHAHLQYIHNKYAWFQNDLLKTVREVDYTNYIPCNAKSCLKWSSKGSNSVKINFSSTKKPICTSSICLQQVCKVSKRSIKNCGRSWLHKLYHKVWQTDGQTDGHRQTGANLNAPWLSSQGHKNGMVVQGQLVEPTFALVTKNWFTHLSDRSQTSSCLDSKLIIYIYE